MLHRQRGISLIGALLTGIALVMMIILGMKVAPVYTEYLTASRAIKQLGDGNSPEDVRRVFENKADVGDIVSFSKQDLIISKENGRFVVSVQWERRVHLFSNVALVFDFTASNTGNAAPVEKPTP